jgi:hypothetical protein
MSDQRDGPPKEVEGQAEAQPSINSLHRSHAGSPTAADYTRRRRCASRRVPPLACGCADPWPCRCTAAPLAAYPAAAMYLLSLGLTPAPDRDSLRTMYRRGGCHRQAAERIATAWEMK